MPRNAFAGPSAVPTGRARIVFAREPGGGTFVRRQFAAYPFHLCRAHRFPHDPAGMVTIYLQSLSGGIFQADELDLSCVFERGSRAQITTQASTIVHGAAPKGATQRVAIDAQAGTLVEYLPDPLILFPGARLESRLNVRVAKSATVIASESFLAHDPEGRGRVFDRYSSATQVTSAKGEILASDRILLDGRAFAEGLPGVISPNNAQGSIFVIDRRNAPDVLVSMMRDALEDLPGLYAGASILPNACGGWARLLAVDGAVLRGGMEAVWSSLRELLVGRRPIPRRK